MYTPGQCFCLSRVHIYWKRRFVCSYSIYRSRCFRWCGSSLFGKPGGITRVFLDKQLMVVLDTISLLNNGSALWSATALDQGSHTLIHLSVGVDGDGLNLLIDFFRLIFINLYTYPMITEPFTVLMRSSPPQLQRIFSCHFLWSLSGAFWAFWLLLAYISAQSIFPGASSEEKDNGSVRVTST